MFLHAEVQLFAMFILAVRGRFIHEVKRLNIRTKCKDTCDYLTVKYVGPFASIIKVAYLKVSENIHRFLRIKRTETRENTRYRKHCSCIKKNRSD